MRHYPAPTLSWPAWSSSETPLLVGGAGTMLVRGLVPEVVDLELIGVEELRGGNVRLRYAIGDLRSNT